MLGCTDEFINHSRLTLVARETSLSATRGEGGEEAVWPEIMV